MDSEFEPVCDNCGLCCSSYTFWMENRSFDKDPLGIKQLMEYHDLTPQRNKKGELGVKICNKCRHQVSRDNKVFCGIYDSRPPVCRAYFCERAIRKGLEAKFNGVHV